MSTIPVTGANRGIGLELAKQYRDAGETVIATVREGAYSAALEATGAEIMTLDTGDPDSIAAFAGALGDRAIDMLIANAGTYGPRDFDREAWLKTLAVNTIAPVELALAIKANLMAGERRVAIAISSEMASIADISAGHSIAYRSSKAALNSAWKTLSIAWAGDGFTLTMIHPGWVRTDMGGANANIDAPESISGIRRVISGLTRADNGAFLNYRGETMPW